MPTTRKAHTREDGDGDLVIANVNGVHKTAPVSTS